MLVAVLSIPQCNHGTGPCANVLALSNPSVSFAPGAVNSLICGVNLDITKMVCDDIRMRWPASHRIDSRRTYSPESAEINEDVFKRVIPSGRSIVGRNLH